MHPIKELLEEKKRLEGDLSPDGAWIETAPIYGRKDWYQAYWRSSSKIFGGKYRKYIGKQGSAKHLKAVAQVANRKRWEQVCLQIESLERYNALDQKSVPQKLGIDRKQY